MKRNNNYTLERVSPYGIRIHSDNVISDLYPSTFVRDMTCHFSILLSQSIDHHGFYTIKAEDDKLKELLCFEDYLFLEYDFDKVLSLDLVQQAKKLAEKKTETPANEEDAEIDALVAQRTQARKDKNWAEADRIRDELNARGIVLTDTPDGVKWSRK